MAEPPPDLSKLHDALDIVCDFLDRSGFSYAIAGGMAVSIWGEPRATYDVDLVVVAGESGAQNLQAAIRTEAAFLTEPQVVPMPPDMDIIRAHLLDRRGPNPEVILVDLLILQEAFAESIQKRKIQMTFAGRQRWVCSCEDLIVLKILSGRVKDLEDVRGLLRIQQNAVDVSYIAEWTSRLNRAEAWQAIHG